jgi:hypothetical protein
MPRPILALFAICLIAVLTVSFLRLSPAQRLEAELADLSPEAALERLAAAQKKGPLDPNLEARLAELALRAGDRVTAREVFERLGLQPRYAATAEAKLAELARLDGDLERAAAHLDAAYRLAPTANMRLRLGGWYRALRDVGGELGVLSAVPPRSLEPFEASRLLQLLAAERRFDAVERVLAELASRQNAGEPWRARFIDFLLDAGRPAAALARARSWTAADPESTTLTESVAAFLDRGAVQEATMLASESLSLRPRTTHVVLLSFVERGYIGIAVALQDVWLRELGPPDSEAWATITEIAARTGNIDGIRFALDLVRDRPGPPEALARALSQMLRYRGPQVLVSERKWLTPAVLQKAPLLAAAVAAQAGRQRSLYDALVSAAEQPLGNWELDLWLSLAQRLRGTPAWFQLLAELPRGTPAAAAIIQSAVVTPASAASK